MAKIAGLCVKNFRSLEESGLWHRFVLIWRVMVFDIKDGYL